MNDHDPGQGIDGIWTSIEVVDDQSPGHLDQNILYRLDFGNEQIW